MTAERFQTIRQAARGKRPACEAELRLMLRESVDLVTRLAQEMDIARAHLADARKQLEPHA